MSLRSFLSRLTPFNDEPALSFKKFKRYQVNDSDLPVLWNETTKAALKAYPEVKTSVFRIISQVVDDTNRTAKISKHIGHIAHVDIADWAILVKRLTVTGHSAEIELFGGRTVHTILRIGDKDVHKKRGAVAP